MEVQTTTPAGYVVKHDPVTISKEDKLIAKAKNILLSRMKNSNAIITSTDCAQNFCTLALRGKEREVFAVLYLNNAHQLIEYVELSEGTVDAATVYPREVVRKGLSLNATSMILAHNHPAGNPRPSEADKRITARIQEACELVGMSVLDHIIVGDFCLSFAQEGLI